jgi:catechol 2,3-dioxygenase-like lactoylglutathione lyase family enzyme
VPTCRVHSIRRTNTILYCARWADTVSFYAERLALPISFRNDWFVEFELGPGMHLSIADQSRSSIEPNHGAGITLSWEVDDVEEARRLLLAAGVGVSPVGARFGARTIDLFDPERNRIELWQSGG